MELFLDLYLFSKLKYFIFIEEQLILSAEQERRHGKPEDPHELLITLRRYTVMNNEY